MKGLAAILAILICSSIAAQEYKPFARARITEAQWNAYFSEASTKHATSRKGPAGGLVLFSDATTGTFYTFTVPGHPAHPSWVTRRMFEASGSLQIEQIGYFAGDEAAFAQLFRLHQELNAKLREDMHRQR